MRNILPKLAFILITILFVSACSSELIGSANGLQLFMVAEEAYGLGVGAPVYFHGVVVGSVTAVDIVSIESPDPASPCDVQGEVTEKVATAQAVCVSLAIDGDKREWIRSVSGYRINESAYVSVTNQRQVDIEVWDSASPPLADGSTVVGFANPTEYYWEKVNAMGDLGLTMGELMIHTEISAAGPVTRTYLMETTRYLPTQELLQDLVPATMGWNIEESLQDDVRLLHVSRTFASVDELAEADISSNLYLTVTKSLLGRRYAYRQDFEPGQFAVDYEALSRDEWKTYVDDWYARLNEEQPDVGGVFRDVIDTLGRQIKSSVTPLERIGVTISVQLPGAIDVDATNADYVTDNQASWLTDVQELDGGYYLHAAAKGGWFADGNQRALILPLLIGGGVIVLIVIGYLVFSKISQRKRRRYSDDVEYFNAGAPVDQFVYDGSQRQQPQKGQQDHTPTQVLRR